VTILLVTVILIARFWKWYYQANTGQDETIYFRTEDGWRLALHHYAPKGPARGLPVVLCHGLASNRFTFDLPGEASLARYLSSHGRDVWVPELRGSGWSDHPGLLVSDVPYTWKFEDHLHWDVPAIVAEVCSRTGADRLHWVGHSMGGLLGLAFLSQQEHAPYASVVALGSPVDFTRIHLKAFRILLKFRWILQFTRVAPMPYTGSLLLPVAHKLPTVLLGLFYPPNIRPIAARKVVALCSQLVTSQALWLDFGRFLAEGFFASPAGRPYLESLQERETPVLLLAGSRDSIAPADAVVAACGSGPSRGERQCRIFGKQTGCGEDYGHMDLMVGMRSESEVFPPILEWLDRHDPAASDA
jgi:pimeloyl-ACP methyl ester carboxylesterase